MFAVLSHLCLAAVTCAVDASFRQPSAVLWKDQLFVAVHRPQYESIALFRGSFPHGGPRFREPVEYGVPFALGVRGPCHLSLAHDRLLAATNETLFIFSLGELPLLEESAVGDKLRELRGYESLSHFTDNHRGELTRATFPEHRAPDAPLPDGDPDERPFQRAERFRAHWADSRVAVYVNGADTARVFHARPGKFFVSTEPDFLTHRTLNNPQYPERPPKRELRTGALPADFTELFSAYRVDSRDYLVTARGRVFMVTPRGRDRVEVSAVWDEPARRIVGVVQDANTGAVYGWGYAPARGATARFCVKLGPKPNAIPYVCDAPLGAGYADAFVESYACARAVRPSLDK